VKYAAEFRRCLVDLDVPGARRLWAHVHRGWDQPASDYEMLVLLHMARTRARSIHPLLKDYSRRWLKERETGGVAASVGVATLNANSEDKWTRRRSRNIRDAMSDSAARSIKAGIDPDREAFEVRRRMLAARRKEIGSRA
jgi:hypothetical protein